MMIFSVVLSVSVVESESVVAMDISQLATESVGVWVFVVVSSEEKGETVGEGEETNKVGIVAVLNVALTECCT